MNSKPWLPTFRVQALARSICEPRGGYFVRTPKLDIKSAAFKISMTTPRPSTFAAFFKWANLLLIIIGSTALVLYRLSLRAHTGPDILWFLKIVLAQCVLYVFVAWLVIKARTARSTLLIVIV